MELQYRLGVNLATYRVFINEYSKSGMVVFDEEKLSKEELLRMLSPYEPEIIDERNNDGRACKLEHELEERHEGDFVPVISLEL